MSQFMQNVKKINDVLLLHCYIVTSLSYYFMRNILSLVIDVYSFGILKWLIEKISILLYWSLPDALPEISGNFPEIFPKIFRKFSGNFFFRKFRKFSRNFRLLPNKLVITPNQLISVNSDQEWVSFWLCL